MSAVSSFIQNIVNKDHKIKQKKKNIHMSDITEN